MLPATACATGGRQPGHHSNLPDRGLVPAIQPATTFLLESAAMGAYLSEHPEVHGHFGDNVLNSSGINSGNSGFLYARWASPTNQAASEAVTAVLGENMFNGDSTSEGRPGTHCAGAIILSSGMAAISTVLFALLSPGDHLVCSARVYGGTHEFISGHLKRLGVTVTFVDGARPDAFREAVRAETRMLYAETPANPQLTLVDLEALSVLAKELSSRPTSKRVLSVVDGTFAAFNQRPLSAGIDVLIHSATKYLGGHSDVMAGVVLCRDPAVRTTVADLVRLLGNSLPAFDSYLLHRGIKTLDVRMERHNKNGLILAKYLEGHEKVARVFYPFLESHPQYKLAKKQLSGGGGMFTDWKLLVLVGTVDQIAFEVKGGLEAGRQLIESVQLINLAVSLGSVESLIEHPASMTHTMVSPGDREQAGITDGLLRLSVGIEAPEDLIADLKSALDACQV